MNICVCCSWHGSAVLSETKFLIHGGYNGNNALSDTFVFDIGEKQIKRHGYLTEILEFEALAGLSIIYRSTASEYSDDKNHHILHTFHFTI